MRQYNVESDLVIVKSLQPVVYKQYDNGDKLKVELYQDGDKIKLTNEKVLAFFELEDGTVIQKTCTIENGNAIATLDNNILSQNGNVKAEFTVYDSKKETTTRTILITVESSINRNESIETTPQWDIVDQLLDLKDSDGQEIGRKIKQLNSAVEDKFEELSAAKQVDSEIILARDGEASLGVRMNKTDQKIDRNHQEVTQQLADFDEQMTENVSDITRQLKDTENQVAITQSSLAMKPNEIDVRMKRDKIKPEDASTEFLALVTGQGVIDLKTIPQNGSVTPLSTNEISGLNMYPFHKKATLYDGAAFALIISKAFIDVEIYGADKLLNYYISRITKRWNRTDLKTYEWSVYLADSTGKTVATYLLRRVDGNNDGMTGTRKIELKSSGNSGVTAEMIVNWDEITDGFSLLSSTFARTGLDRTTLSTFGGFMTKQDEEWVI